jgi:glycosyltransferase involved in cell wall biosynthesis
MARRLENLIANAGLHHRYRYLGSIPNALMPALFRQAGALMYPSSAETFGKPLVEANRCGVPVLASDIPTLREVGQDGAWYLPVGNPSSDLPLWADALVALYSDTARRSSLIERGRRRGQTFSWQRTAEQTLEVILAAGQVRYTTQPPVALEQ